MPYFEVGSAPGRKGMYLYEVSDDGCVYKALARFYGRSEEESRESMYRFVELARERSK